jgi:hypothetical protein
LVSHMHVACRASSTTSTAALPWIKWSGSPVFFQHGGHACSVGTASH